jgi:hypothetical protein
MHNGRRTQVSLRTSDYGEAVLNATKIVEYPFLNESAPLEQEGEAFLAHKARQNEYSAASAESKKYALHEFAKFTGKRRVADISTADVDRFYRALQQRVSESTAQGYITTIRSFFNRLVELRKIRHNPVEGVKLARLDQKGRLLFCPPDARDKLIANAPGDEMKFILYCGFHVGLRKNEIIEARPEWFDLEPGRCTCAQRIHFALKIGKRAQSRLPVNFNNFCATTGRGRLLCSGPKSGTGMLVIVTIFGGLGMRLRKTRVLNG